MMPKVDKVVRRETVYIAASVLILSTLTEAVFLILGRWDWTVLLGNLFGGCAAVLNFFLMGLTVQKAVAQDEKTAAQTMKLSQMLRLLAQMVVIVLGIILPCFHWITVTVPLFFPRLALTVRPWFGKKSKDDPAEP